jgi:tripartite-type tricarboxylate transporter receptor subunit TctC
MPARGSCWIDFCRKAWRRNSFTRTNTSLGLGIVMHPVISLVVAVSTIAYASIAAAQTYPAKPVRMIVAFPPGGPTDLVGRIIAAKVAEQTGQQFIVENRAGAGGNIGSEFVAKAAPDGYTILYNTSGITIAQSVYPKLGYDVMRDFAPVLLAATVPLVLVAHPSLPTKSVQEFVAYAKAQNGKINYASSGTGVITHLAGAAFVKELGIAATHVPYKGSAPAIADVVSGQAQFMIDTVNTPLGFIRDGRLRALAVAMPKRSTLLPDVPTFNETVMPNFEMSAWQGVVAPAGTPKQAIDRLNTEFNKAVQNADVRAKLANQGAEPLGGTVAEYAAYLKSEITRFARIVKDAGVKLE